MQFINTEKLEQVYFATSWYSYKSFALDGQLYNIVFISSVYETLMSGLFNCPYEEREWWEPVALQMIAAIREYTEEAEI